MTWRITVIETEDVKKYVKNGSGALFAHWHGDELVLIGLIKKYNIATMTSTSRDGNLMNRVIHYLGGKTVRGSSTRGGISALKGLVRLIKSGKNASMAVDGPKGPIHHVKPGIFELSRLTHTPIIPGAASCSHAFHFVRSWNKSFIPYPFAKVVIFWGPTLEKFDRYQDPHDPELSMKLKLAIFNAKEQSLKYIAPCKS